jgi:hypothetical protein
MMLIVAAILQSLGNAQHHRDLRLIARQLAEDQLEILKSRAFPDVYLTSDSDAPLEGCLHGRSAYDRNADQFPPEDLHWGSTVFRRQTCVEQVQPDVKEGTLVRVSSGPATGLKRVVVRVLWPAPNPTLESEQESILQDSANTHAMTENSTTLAALSLTSNQEATLVVASHDIASDLPPDVAMDAAQTSIVYSKIVHDPVRLWLPPGNYFVRCWWTDSHGRARMMDPPGGINVALSAGDFQPLACHFNE